MEVDKLAIHLDVERVVDKILRGAAPRPEIRIRNEDGLIEVVQRSDETGAIREIPDRDSNWRPQRPQQNRTTVPAPTERRQPAVDDDDLDEDDEDLVISSPRFGQPGGNGASKPLPSTVRIFPYGVSRSRLDRAIAETRVPAYIARDVSDADVVLALKATYKREPGKMREAAQRRLPVYVVKSNTYAQIAGTIREIFRLAPASSEPIDNTETALQEVQDAIDRVKETNEPVELSPANSYTRRMQHQLVERYQLVSESVGVEPYRRVRILPVTA
jgi:hypothetical protein